MMRRSLALLAAAPVLVVGLASCSTTVTTTTPSAPPATGGADSGNSAKVDAYCNQVQQLVDKANQLKANPDTQLSKELAQEAQDLAQQAVSLVGAVANDPALASRVSQCSSDAAAAAGTGG